MLRPKSSARTQKEVGWGPSIYWVGQDIKRTEFWKSHVRLCSALSQLTVAIGHALPRQAARAESIHRHSLGTGLSKGKEKEEKSQEFGGVRGGFNMTIA